MIAKRPRQTRAAFCAAAALTVGVLAVASPATAQEDEAVDDVETTLDSEEMEDVLDVAEDAAEEAEELSEYLQEQAEEAKEASDEAAEDAEDAEAAEDEGQDDDTSEAGEDLARAKDAVTRTLQRWEAEGKPGNGVAPEVLTALVEGRSPAGIGRDHGKEVAAAMAEKRAERFEARAADGKPGKGPKSVSDGEDSDDVAGDAVDAGPDTEKPGNSQGKGQGGESSANSQAGGKGKSVGKGQGKGPKADR